VHTFGVNDSDLTLLAVIEALIICPLAEGETAKDWAAPRPIIEGFESQRMSGFT